MYVFCLWRQIYVFILFGCLPSKMVVKCHTARTPTATTRCIHREHFPKRKRLKRTRCLSINVNEDLYLISMFPWRPFLQIIYHVFGAYHGIRGRSVILLRIAYQQKHHKTMKQNRRGDLWDFYSHKIWPHQISEKPGKHLWHRNKHIQVHLVAKKILKNSRDFFCISQCE